MPQQNEEGNKLIAEFMGYKGVSTDSESFDSDPDGIYIQLYAKYWDWLMPVVEKIESIYDDHHGYFGVHIHSNACDIQGTNLWKAIKPGSEYGAVYMSDPNAIFPTKIESTWYAVVQFIKWYNHNLCKTPSKPHLAK